MSTILSLNSLNTQPCALVYLFGAPQYVFFGDTSGLLEWLDANHVARAQPFDGGFAGDLLRHLQEDLDGGTDEERRICRELDTYRGEIHRFGPLLCNCGLQNATLQGQPEVVTRRDTTVW